ncbi:50S ribosomal protein L23 [Pseudalkalibacillus berkeleyi]|uniref:Large ribosomal subunit protein uL23 n=1 Tax=Pseudalkalibacillus berkeleyi TaxID=1069813 RepID=A0ABS9H3F1_9BACL|nr:50S ribosomal protein L23 [Pseudalkalibacillus berkeleyi]MCF6139472.1 50S ribosomal protein L23 [Pseudalkalibacillus berkeleyi]
MADAREIIKRPVITERTTEIMGDRKYTFEVDPRANKTQIKNAIEEIFGVKVENVNTQNYKGKKKRVGRYFGYTSKRKKAIVQLTSESKELDFFEGV